jgi:uncharacterized membrane protein
MSHEAVEASPDPTLRDRVTFAPPEWFRRFRSSLSIPGLLVGTLFFAISLTPSLLPRGWVMQGILSGLCLSAGYGLGVGYRWVWGYLELPFPRDRVRRWGLWIAAGICVLVAIGFLWQASSWQNSVRGLMELEPVEGTRPVQVGLLAFVLFSVILGIARLIHSAHRFMVRRLGSGVPRRVANVLSLLLVVTASWAILDGVVFQQMLRLADDTFERIDAGVEAETAAPTNPDWTGGAASLVAWEDLGRRGREFVAGTTSAASIAELTDREAMEPVRVYIGLNAAETPGERAELALAELERRGAFDRSVLAIVVPTGTGWVDPAALSTLEYLHDGDVASVAIQYSYLPSWLTLLSEPQYGAETAHALFDAVYGHWTGFPDEARPDLYLHGVSLGAHNSQLSSDLYDVIADPFAGALWVGPPFRSETWRDLTLQRDPASPPWLPRFRDGSVVRFMNQWETSHPSGTPWSPLRIMYLQYASDPITFFEPQAFYRPPEWLDDPRAPDVSERLRWYPIVTALQLLGDLAIADGSPPGYGHVFAAEHYVDAWLAVTDPEGWTASDIQRLKDHLAEADGDSEEP